MESKFEKLCENTVQPKLTPHDEFATAKEVIKDKFRAAKAAQDLVRIKGVHANPTQDAFLIAKDLRDRTGSNGPEAGASWVEIIKRLHFAGYTITKR